MCVLFPSNTYICEKIFELIKQFWNAKQLESKIIQSYKLFKFIICYINGIYLFSNNVTTQSKAWILCTTIDILVTQISSPTNSTFTWLYIPCFNSLTVDTSPYNVPSWLEKYSSTDWLPVAKANSFDSKPTFWSVTLNWVKVGATVYNWKNALLLQNFIIGRLFSKTTASQNI